MTSRAWRILTLAIVLVAIAGSKVLEGQSRSSTEPPKKVLVELYTSQGCNSCPAASDLVGQLARMGYGPDRVVTINFHVDYFNQPWIDPYSDKAYSQRQVAYNKVLKRDDLYFTPLLMVDGRIPMLGSDKAKVTASLRQSTREIAEVHLELTLSGDGPRKTLTIKLDSPSASVVGRELFLGVALTEDPVTTDVPSGENAGQTLVEHDVARRLDHKFATLEKSRPKTLTFPIELPEKADPAKFRLAVFAQDRMNGKVYQAESTPWITLRPADLKAKKAQARKANRRILAELEAQFGLITSPTPVGEATNETATCPDCGSKYVPWMYLSMPGGHTLPPGIQLPVVPKISC